MIRDDSSSAEPEPIPATSGQSPFHSGEIELQRRAGVHERMDQIGRAMIRDHMPDQHREFFALLPTLLVAGLDADCQPWATMLAGPAGFVSTPDAHHLRVATLPEPVDPLSGCLTEGMPLGLLGLQPHTRRRNRMNGLITAIDAAGFEVGVRQSFGNCPKYIQAREPSWIAPTEVRTAPVAVAGGAVLDEALCRHIRNADTFFIASVSTEPDSNARGAGLDISHRGGTPGFVRIDHHAGHSVLTVPDFVGNSLYNTLGNLLVNPACGLLFVDYADGGLLHLSGTGEVVWSGDEIAHYGGAQRLWRCRIQRSLWRPRALPLTWSQAEPAPQLAQLGRWPDAT